MPPARNAYAAKRLHFGETTLILVVAMLFTAASSALAYATKVGCTTPSEPGAKREWLFGQRGDVIPCYSDLMTMWHGRGLASHVFPYIHGGITPDGHLFGGVVEYPVLSGLFMWLSGLGANTDREFLWHSLLFLAPFAFIIAILLALMTRWWSMLWVATPPLMLYALHNWELPVVAAAVAGVAVMAWGGSADPGTGHRRWSVQTTAIIAAIPLGVGFSFKIYPGLFVLPLMLWVLTRGEVGDRRRDPRRGSLDWLGAGYVALSAIVTVAITQVPFMIAGYDGWKAAIDFQSLRQANLSTNSIWYWGLRFLTGGETPIYNSIVDVASPLLIVVAFAVSCYLGWRVYRRDGAFPWLGVSAAMLAGFMLFHKVHSPQYTLWILPFFILLRVRWWLIALYLVADTVLDLTIFHLLLNYSPTTHGWVIAGVNIGVWTHAVILLVLIVVFVHAKPREPLASYLTGTVPSPGPLTRLRAVDDTDAQNWLGTPTLVSGPITLRPLELSDAEDLGKVASDADLYRWTSGVPHDTASAIAWIRSALTNPHRIPFAVIDADGTLVGTTSFYDVDAANQTLAVGYTFYSPAAMGTAVNPAAKLALCEYAFTVADAVRVVWHTHEENAQSRAAITKLGAVEEGLLRKHRRFRGGWRTTAQFAIVDDDWPASRELLQARVAKSATKS
ncbi:GNAT family N-acetyltransferase [Gordonia phthalatica]|uniref:N-acetyltransferase domain-containing protein n=1 Tax=Gordonia phthalatica TaxID=1136941 RepID=A0A0N9MUU0_9ACTN|nr:GNAT family N-acetyltransferase [Gordonia phthalatica]ALG86396.1 hypothetical protein ACH46_20245 [Gordonia phthalatica]